MSCMPHSTVPLQPQCKAVLEHCLVGDMLVLCRAQLKRRDEDFAGLQSVHDAVKGQLEQQNGDLSSKLSKVNVKII